MFWGYICFLQGHSIESLAALSFPWTHHGTAWMILISFLPSYVSINLSWSICVFSCNFSVKSKLSHFSHFTISEIYCHSDAHSSFDKTTLLHYSDIFSKGGEKRMTGKLCEMYSWWNKRQIYQDASFCKMSKLVLFFTEKTLLR